MHEAESCESISNIHRRKTCKDSTTFPLIYEKLKESFIPYYIVADDGYINSTIAKMLLDDDVTPVFPYKKPITKYGFFKKHAYVYYEYYDCDICPNNQALKYSITNRDGYKEYKSNPVVCEGSPYLSHCTLSKNHQKLALRHVWCHVTSDLLFIYELFVGNLIFDLL